MEEVRTRLRGSLTRQVHHEIEGAAGRVEEAIKPYRSFVAGQQGRLHEARGELVAVEDALGLLKRRVKGDLTRFREYIEERGTETGAWRGEVHPPDTLPPR